MGKKSSTRASGKLQSWNLYARSSEGDCQVAVVVNVHSLRWFSHQDAGATPRSAERGGDCMSHDMVLTLNPAWV